MAEWFKAPVLKTGVGASPPWVRIPPHPPAHCIRSSLVVSQCLDPQEITALGLRQIVSACTPNFIPKVGLRVGLDMSKELLTAHRIRAISKPGIYKDGGGLRLIVTARRKKRWELWISINGKKRQLGLGEVSLAEARDKADEIRRAARNGIDLLLQRTNNKARTVSFRQAFETYFDIERKQLSNAKHLQAMAEHNGDLCFSRVWQRSRSQTSRLLK